MEINLEMEKDHAEQVVVEKEDGNRETKKRSSWNEVLSGLFLDAYLSIVRKGKSSDGTSLKAAAWTTVVKKFQSKSQTCFTKSKLQSHMSVLKKKYAIWKWLSEFSGFSVTENGKIVADDACWDDLIELHKEEKEKLAFIKFFRKNALVHLDKMEEVFDGNIATGRFSRSSTENYDESEE